MTWLIWLAAGEAVVILALIVCCARLCDTLDGERQRLALLRRLR